MFNKTVRGRALTNAIKATLTGAAAVAILTTGVAEGSAKGRHHRQHHAKVEAVAQDWRDANAAIRPSQHAGRSFSGVASHYGLEAGNRTASGQRMNPSAMTTAHRSLPFGTKLRVSHGSRSVIVTVNDRGPFVRGRVLDLSNGAARAIGLNGLGRVTAEVL